MRELKVNKMVLPKGNMEIKYEIIENTDKNSNVVQFKTYEPHGLVQGSKVILKKTFKDEQYERRLNEGKYTIPTENVFNVEVEDEFTFNIIFDKYTLVHVNNLAYDKQNSPAILEILDKTIYHYVNDVRYIGIKSAGQEYQGSLGVYIGDVGEESYDQYIIDIEEDASAMFVMVNKPIVHLGEDGYVYFKNTWHLTDVDGNFDSANISIYEYNRNIVSALSLSTSVSYRLNDDNIIGNMFLEDIKNSVLPEIIDNEKMQFIPAMAKGGNFKIAKEIEFNLHFRERTKESKDIDDDGEIDTILELKDDAIWNRLRWGMGNSFLEYETNDVSGNLDDTADELNCLDFTEDDVKYQKMKLKKSFLRIMFYSSKDILDKNLLYYSTIFLDTTNLYKTYGMIKNNNLSVFDETRTDRKLRLPIAFNVKNKYDKTKSSEGFYLYLFPNEIAGENEATTIYMKVEFNHAGLGQTIQMMMPRYEYALRENGEYNTNALKYDIYNPPVSPTNKYFPFTFLKKEKINDVDMLSMDIERYTDSVMIPVNIKYDKNLKSYIYYFPWFNRANEDRITINLWEPRTKGSINGTI